MITAALSFILGLSFASAFWLIANQRTNDALRRLLRDADTTNLALRQRLDALERFQLEEASNPQDWWIAKSE